MYSTADYSVTPRPNYLADGRKLPDCYSYPASLRDELQEKFGQFPLFNFWGPGADIRSSEWIANAAMYTDDRYNPTLTLIYLPHLDYCLQKFGPDTGKIAKELGEIDNLAKKLVQFYASKNTRVVILSEYGIAPVSRPIHLNRLLRRNNLLQIRVERGRELLDAGASKAFAVADHQVAHIYCNDRAVMEQVSNLIKGVPGVKKVLDKKEQAAYHIDHERAGELVVMADADSWFTYYYWTDDNRAPDFARSVEIFKKPGYDPVEMFMSSKLRAGYKLLRKKTGLRYVMDVIPLDATLVKGSHGSMALPDTYHAVLITRQPVEKKPLEAVDVYDVIWKELIG